MKHVTFTAFELVVYAHVHVHLANVLMGKLSCLEIDEYEALEQVVYITRLATSLPETAWIASSASSSVRAQVPRTSSTTS